MLLEKASAQGRWMMKFVGLLWATGFLWIRGSSGADSFAETFARLSRNFHENFPVLWRFLRHT